MSGKKQEKLQLSRLMRSGFVSADGDGPLRSSSPSVGSEMSKLSPSDTGSDGDSGIGLTSPCTVGSFDFFDDCAQLSSTSSSPKCTPIQSSTPSSSINWSSDEGSDADFDHDEALIDENTAFESELSWDDESASDRGYNRVGDACDSIYDSSIVSGLPDIGPSSRSRKSAHSKSQPIACARARSRRGEQKSYFISTPHDFAGLEVKRRYPTVGCGGSESPKPSHDMMYKLMQKLSVEARPSETNVFRSFSSPHDPFWDTGMAPTLSCISR